MSDKIAAETGQFQTTTGQIADPSGYMFNVRGIAVDPSKMGDADQILAAFPGLNFVRLTAYTYDVPSTYTAFVDTMTSHGVVVEFEDHTSSDGSNEGGSRGSAYTGTALSDELHWYSSLATAYASNPYVWFGTDNEPPNDGLTAWQQQTYNAIRSTGNTSPILLELPGGAYPGNQTVTSYGMDPAVYATMYNTIVDVHAYGWSSGFDPDQQVVDNTITDLIQGAHTVPSANGPTPVVIAEYGIGTAPDAPDANASQVLWAAQHIAGTAGAAAFTWNGSGVDTLTDNQGQLTAYGQEVAQWIASTASGQDPAAATPTSAVVGQPEIAAAAVSPPGMLLAYNTAQQSNVSAISVTDSDLVGPQSLSAAMQGDGSVGNLPDVMPATMTSSSLSSASSLADTTSPAVVPDPALMTNKPSATDWSGLPS